MTNRRFSTPGLTRRLLALIAALLRLVVGLSVFILPSPTSTIADPTIFSAERVMAVVNRLADKSHSVLHREAHDRARDDVVSILSNLGCTPTAHFDPLPDLGSPRAKEISGALSAERQAEFRDALAGTIVVDVSGKSKRAMALVTHYDSVIGAEPDGNSICLAARGSHRAGDDGYGVAVIAEMLRALRTKGRQPENSLKIVITGAEEVDPLDATNEMRHHRADYEDVDPAPNFEAHGTSSPAFTFEILANNSAVADYFLNHVRQPVTSLLFPSLYARMPNLTDMTALTPEGFMVLSIMVIGNAEHYHHATGVPRYVDHSTVQHYGGRVLDFTRAWTFDGQAPTLTADGDLHFF